MVYKYIHVHIYNVKENTSKMQLCIWTDVKCLHKVSSSKCWDTSEAWPPTVLYTILFFNRTFKVNLTFNACCTVRPFVAFIWKELKWNRLAVCAAVSFTLLSLSAALISAEQILNWSVKIWIYSNDDPDLDLSWLKLKLWSMLVQKCSKNDIWHMNRS